MDILDPILRAVGAVILAGGGLAGIVFIFRHLAVKWLDNQFASRLQALKHSQNQEIEEMRFKIAALLDRTVKLHQREFDALPDAWFKLNEAF